MVAVCDFTPFLAVRHNFCSMLDTHASVKQVIQYKAYKTDKTSFIFKRMLFASFTEAHVVFGRGNLSSPLMAIFTILLKFMISKLGRLSCQFK